MDGMGQPPEYLIDVVEDGKEIILVLGITPAMFTFIHEKDPYR